MKVVGILVLLNVLGLVAYFSQQENADFKRIAGFGGLGLLVGMGILLSERVTGIKVSGIGVITAAAERAIADAKEIEQIRKDVAKQGETIGLVLRDANAARSKIEQIDSLLASAEARTATIEETARRADEGLTRIQTVSDFTLLLAQAQNDNRVAFNSLVRISEQPGEFKQLAFNGVQQVLIDIDPLVSIRINPKIPLEKYGLNSASSSINEFDELYHRIPAYFKPDLLTKIWEAKHLTKKQKLEFFAEVLRTDDSLLGIQRACSLFNLESKLNKNILGTNLYLDWWEANKQRY
jgi:hypothetical protein